MLPRFSPATSASAADRRSWADLLRRHFVTLDVAQAPDAVAGSVDSYLVGHLQLSTVRSVSQDVVRSQTLIRSDRETYLQIGLVRSGRALVRQDGRLAELGPGDFTVYETTRPFDWSLRAAPGQRQWELSVFTWPRSAFRLSEARSRDLTARRLAASCGVTRVMSGLLAELASQQVTLDAGQADAFADELGDLLGVVLADRAVADGAPARRHDDLLRAVDRYIDENLADPDLSPETIAKATLISTRQLHRLFLGREQTVAQTIRARRLEGARREIISCVATDRSLREIARHWGFLDLAVFSRAFRQAYGMTPRQYRALQCRLSGDPRAYTRSRR